MKIRATIGLAVLTVSGIAGCAAEAGGPEGEDLGSATHTLIASQRSLVRNDYLLPGQTMVSSGCGFALKMGFDGNLSLFGYPTSGGSIRLWSANTAGSLAVMQPDGNLVVYNSSMQALFVTGTAGNPGAFATPQWDGNLVVYRADNAALWVSHTNGPKFTRTCVTNRDFVHMDPGTTRTGNVLKTVQVAGSNPTMLAAQCADECRFNSSSQCASFTVVTVHSSPLDFYGRCNLFTNAGPRSNSPGLTSGIYCKFSSGGLPLAGINPSPDCDNDALRQL